MTNNLEDGAKMTFAMTLDLAVDIKKKRILSLEVRSEELVDNATENNNLKGIVADGMYDSNNNFRYLSKNHIKPGIKTRSNSKVKSTNCHTRNMSVVRQQTNLKRWKRSVSYGYRWIADTAFSSIKRIFGEHVTARKFHNMVKEILLKAALYNFIASEIKF
ncbi:MAG: transposase [Candidatus Nitrosopolaris sp.]